jgi:hypothetical protein
MGQHNKSFEVFTDLGLSNGMAQGTSVLTLDGDIPVEFLNIGDKVLTHSGIRLLKSIEVSVVKNARMSAPRKMFLSPPPRKFWCAIGALWPSRAPSRH